MRDSTRIRRNFPSLSLRLRSRCFLQETAFLIRKYRSSGSSGARLQGAWPHGQYEHDGSITHEHQWQTMQAIQTLRTYPLVLRMRRILDPVMVET